MPVFPIGEWLPDQPVLGFVGEPGPKFSPYTALAKNVVPNTAQSYGPMPSPSASGAVLPAKCIGTYAMRDNSGVAYTFAGTAENLYRVVGADTAFAEVGGLYAASDDGWSMATFGARIIAVNYAVNSQSMLVGVDPEFTDLSADAPRARYVGVIRDFVFLGNTYDVVDGNRPRRVWWPAIADPLSWPTPGTDAAVQVQSDYQDLEQSDLGQVTGVVGGVSGAHGIIFCERGIYRADYQGSPAIFNFDAIEGSSGTRAPRSVILSHLRNGGSVVSVASYLGEDGFYSHDGNSAIPIGDGKVNKWFFDNLNATFADQVIGASHPSKPLNVWGFSSVRTFTGSIDMLLVHNWNINMWAFCDLAATPLETLVRVIFGGYTLEELDQFGDIDHLPRSLDSPFWIGGGMALGGFNTAHALVRMVGANLAPVVETVEMQPISERRSSVLMARPIADGDGTTIATGVRDSQWGTVAYGPSVAANIYGECPQLSAGRYIRFRVGKPAGSVFTHIQGVDTGTSGIRPLGKI